jgi:hypothetical protein
MKRNEMKSKFKKTKINLGSFSWAMDGTIPSMHSQKCPLLKYVDDSGRKFKLRITTLSIAIKMRHPANPIVLSMPSVAFLELCCVVMLSVAA